MTEWRAPTLDERTAEWIARAKEAGLALCLCSNSSRPGRVRKMAQALGIEYVSFANKPNPLSVFRGLKVLKAKREEAAVVGDQIFTDVLAGKLSGARSIWVRPISAREFIFTRLMRLVERAVIGALKKRDCWPQVGVVPEAQGGSGADTR